MSDPHATGEKKGGFPIGTAVAGLLLLFVFVTVVVPGCSQGIADSSVILAQSAQAGDVAQNHIRKWLTIIGNIILFVLIGGLIVFAVTKKKDGGGGGH